MDSPPRSALRSEYQPAKGSPLRSVFSGTTGSSGRTRKSHDKTGRTGRVRDVGTPFALTIPPLPPSSITVPRRKSTPKSRGGNDENAPLGSPETTVRKDRYTNKRTAIPPGDQTIFAPVLLGVGDQSLLMEQQLPTYKDLWNESEEEGEDELSFMVDSMEQHGGAFDGSVRSRARQGRKSILGQSTADNRITKSTQDQSNTSRLASLYKPTPKPDASSRRRSTLLARNVFPISERQLFGGGVQDVLVPLYGASSPMLGKESTPMALSFGRDRDPEKARMTAQTLGGSDTEEDEDGEVGNMDEQMHAVSERQSGSQVFPSQASLVYASQAIPEMSQTRRDSSQPFPARTSTARRASPAAASGAATPRRSSANAASRKRTPSQRPEGNVTPSRASALLTASARNSPNPRARKTARKSTKAAKAIVQDVAPSSPAVPLATETREARMSMGLASAPEKTKSRRRSTAAPAERSRRPRASRANQAPAELIIPKTRRLSGRKSTGSIPTSLKTASDVKRARHSLSAAAKAKSESPKGRRRPRQSLAPLELVERVGLLDIPQRPASPTEDPLLLIPSARKSVGARRSDAPSQGTVQRQRIGKQESVAVDEIPQRRSIESERLSPVPADLSMQDRSGDEAVNEPNLPLEQGPPSPSTPSTHSVSRPTSLTRALGSSPWVCANLSIFSPTAMASSPIRPSPVRWRIASPLPEELAPTISMLEPVEAEPSQAVEAEEMQVQEDRVTSPESTPRRRDASHQEERVSLTPTLVNDTEDEPQYQDAEVGFLPDTEWRAFERDHSPLSDHDEESGDVGEESADVDEGGHINSDRAQSPNASPITNTVVLQDEANAPQSPELNFSKSPASPGPPSPAEVSNPLPDSPSKDDTASEAVTEEVHPIASKKKVGRICLRLPLQPIIIKIEPVDVGEFAHDGSAEQDDIVLQEEEASEEVPSAVRYSSHSSEEESADAHHPIVESGYNEPNKSIIEPERLLSPPSRQLPLATVDTTEVVAPAGARPDTTTTTSATEQLQELSEPRSSVSAHSLAALAEIQSPSRNTNQIEVPLVPSEGTPADPPAETAIESAATIASPAKNVQSPVRRPSVAYSSTTLVHAESPFQSKIVIEPVASPANVAVHDTPSAERIFRESVSSVSVTSEDPRAAARAAALLKLHFHYLNDGPGNDTSLPGTIPPPENVKISPRRRRISQYFQSAETASSLSLPELLQEAELELMDTTAASIPTSSAMKKGSIPFYSPFPMPGSWASINNGGGSPFQRGRIDCAQWTIEDWQDLERCYKRLYKKRLRTSSVNNYVLTFEDGTEVIDNLCKLKRITKGELRDEWSSQTLRLRINTLHRKRKSNDESVIDLPVVALSSLRSPKRLKANDSSIVESSMGATTMPTSHKFKSLFSRGWQSVMKILDPVDRSASTQQPSASSTDPTERHTVTVDLGLPVASHPETLPAATPTPKVPGSAPAPAPGTALECTPQRAALDVTTRAPPPSDMRQIQTPQPSELRQVIARRASVLARAKQLNDAVQGQATPLVQSQLARTSSASLSGFRKNLIPDASSSRPIISLPRRSLVSQESSPSVKNMIQSFERSFESDESPNSSKGESPVANELRRLSSRRSVSGKSSLREVLEKSMDGAKHDTP